MRESTFWSVLSAIWESECDCHIFFFFYIFHSSPPLFSWTNFQKTRLWRGLLLVARYLCQSMSMRRVPNRGSAEVFILSISLSHHDARHLSAPPPLALHTLLYFRHTVLAENGRVNVELLLLHQRRLLFPPLLWNCAVTVALSRCVVLLLSKPHGKTSCVVVYSRIWLILFVSLSHRMAAPYT